LAVASFAFIRDLNPQLDDLPTIVKIIAANEGDNDAIAAAIEVLFKDTDKRKGFTTHSIKANTMSSLREDNLGVMTPDGHLTKFGKQLLSLVSKDDAFKTAVAQHLIFEKGGLAFCRALENLTEGSGRREQIADFLVEKHGVDFWRDLNNISSMHNFLEWAGICQNYKLNHTEFEKIAGIDTTTAKSAEELPQEANMLLQALARAPEANPLRANCGAKQSSCRARKSIPTACRS
jgi:hypothetical protein